MDKREVLGILNNFVAQETARAKAPSAPAPLPKYFRAKDKGDAWHLFCRKCGKGWSLKKASNHPGNHLHLLNHARSHE